MPMPNPTAETLIADLDQFGIYPSNRLLHICERAEIKSVGDLAAKTTREFWVNKHCGHKTVAEARMILSEAGLAFLNEARGTTLNSRLENTGIRFDKTDVTLKELPRELCDECDSNIATHYLAIDLRALGGEGMLTEEKFCQECGAGALRDLQESLPDPLNEDGTF